MKQLVALSLLVTLLTTLGIPVAAQKRTERNTAPIKSKFAEFERVEAVSTGHGAFVRWQMVSETNNVGFYVYRLGRGGRERVDEMTLSASARGFGPTAYGEAYDVYDPAGSLGSTYIVTSLAMDGREMSSEAVTAGYTNDAAAFTGRSSDRFNPKVRKGNGQIEKRTLVLPQDLADEVRAALDAPDLSTHRWVVSQPGAKIGVRQEGFYRVTRAELQAAGFDVGSDSTKWRLFAEGVEQSIIVGPGDQYIEFYGKGIDTNESDTRIYYLLADTTPGKRIATKVLRNIAGGVVSRNYAAASEKRERTLYLNQFMNGDADNYWGRLVTTQSTTINFTLTGVDATAGPSAFRLKMHGFSASVLTVNTALNGNALPQALGNGPLPFEVSGEIPANFLVDGNNTLQLTMASSGQISVFDSITINYGRRYQADQNKVSFYTPGYRTVDLGNFSTANVRVFDTTYDGDPILITGLPVVQEGATFTAKLPSHRAMVMYGVEDSGLLQPAGVTRNVGSTLSVANNAANMLIISHSAPDFMAAAETWANYRRSATGGGLTVKVIDVADIFDEYSYGSHSGAAVTSFLNYAVNNWSTPPQYALLLGDASYDPRNYLNFGYLDLIPTKIVPIFEGETGSDEALADFNGDGLADIGIGRLPVRTAAEITTIFNKTTLFETPAMQSFARGALFAHDLPIGYDFQGMNHIMRGEVPGMPATMVDRRFLPSPPAAPNTPDPQAQTDLINGINAGKYIVNYTGHGTTGLWAHGTFFGFSNVPQLTNANSPTVFTMLTCLNGYFLRPDADSVAELLVKASGGGSVASWGSTAKTTPDLQLEMGRRFYNQLNAGNIPRIGDLIRDAKSAVPGGLDVRLSWVLLGDPALKMR